MKTSDKETISRWFTIPGLASSVKSAASLTWGFVVAKPKPQVVGTAEPSPDFALEGPDESPVPEGEDSEVELLFREMMRGKRFALLLRPQLASGLSSRHVQLARAAVDATMSLVPDGEVIVRGRVLESDDEEEQGWLHRVTVGALLLDRYCVTNQDYAAFVATGAYEQMALWDPAVWPAVSGFVDSTGNLGPRFWRNGTFSRDLADHPVVGVNWFEASAYARWVGKRMPTDAEWIKAAAWPIATAGGPPIQRRYPWGDSMDRSLANLWGCRGNGTVPVSEYPAGASCSGVYQLIGNVWEWTTTDFGVWEPPSRKLDLPTPMKSIRGAAFDTYFDSQSTCQYQSGENPLARRHNIGFRCAVALSDLSFFDDGEGRPEPAPSGGLS